MSTDEEVGELGLEALDLVPVVHSGGRQGDPRHLPSEGCVPAVVRAMGLGIDGGSVEQRIEGF